MIAEVEYQVRPVYAQLLSDESDTDGADLDLGDEDEDEDLDDAEDSVSESDN